MTGQQEHRERAARELARRLQPRLIAGVDAYQLARQFMDDLAAEHWRCIPPAPQIAAANATDPATAAARTARGADYARQLLAKNTTTPEGA